MKAVQGAHWRPAFMWALSGLALLVSAAGPARRGPPAGLARPAGWSSSACYLVALLPFASWLIQLVPWWRWNILAAARAAAGGQRPWRAVAASRPRRRVRPRGRARRHRSQRAAAGGRPADRHAVADRRPCWVTHRSRPAGSTARATRRSVSWPPSALIGVAARLRRAGRPVPTDRRPAGRSSRRSCCWPSRWSTRRRRWARTSGAASP